MLLPKFYKNELSYVTKRYLQEVRNQYLEGSPVEEDVRNKKNKVTNHNNHYLKSDSEKESDATISKRVTEFKRLTKERLYFI